MELNRNHLLFIADCGAAFLAVPAALFLMYREKPAAYHFASLGIERIVFFIVVLLFVSFMMEVYRRHREMEVREIAARVFLSMVLSFCILSVFYYAMPLEMYGRSLLVLSLLLFGVLQFSCHAGLKVCGKFLGLGKNILILGAGPLADLMGKLIPSAEENYVLSGYVNCSGEPVHVPQETVLRNEQGLYETVKREKADKIVVSLSERRGVFPLQDVMACKLNGIEVIDAPSFYEQVTGKLLLENITPSWFIFSEGFKITSWRRVAKRMLDLACASAGILLVLPLLPIIALAIKLDSPGPVLFRQRRVGEMEKEFILYKFRTMRADAEQGTGAVWAQENDPRITRTGEFFRKMRIDELPQLFNVLKGDMSLVGPRPERPEFIEELKAIIPYYSERHFVKPGVTGWAQVRYPYGASVEDALEKLRYDLYYIKNISLTFDLLIILETVKVVLFRQGAR